ncbi:hypothetical protein B0G52_117174 [Cohnella sp. SGD-V74]|jgi:hypothetical protein|nr:hypothetical protein B0G52_117174 [Cohnella sp. SGD-V74]
MLSHSQDFIDVDVRCGGGTRERWTVLTCSGMREQKVRHAVLSLGALLHAPLVPWRFTLPCLNGSSPLHSFVVPDQGVETDRVWGTGHCPSCCQTRFSVRSLSMNPANGSAFVNGGVNGLLRVTTAADPTAATGTFLPLKPCHSGGRRLRQRTTVRFSPLHHANHDACQLPDQLDDGGHLRQAPLLV